MVWVETQVLGAKEFAEVVKEWHISLHCHILFNFLLLAKDRQLVMFLFCSLFRWDLFGHYRHHCHPHSVGFENPLLGWAGFGVIVPFYGVLRGFEMGYVGWCIGNVQHSRSAHLSSDLLRNPTLLVPYTTFFLILGWAMSDALKNVQHCYRYAHLSGCLLRSPTLLLRWLWGSRALSDSRMTGLWVLLSTFHCILSRNPDRQGVVLVAIYIWKSGRWRNFHLNPKRSSSGVGISTWSQFGSDPPWNGSTFGSG